MSLAGQLLELSKSRDTHTGAGVATAAVAMFVVNGTMQCSSKFRSFSGFCGFDHAQVLGICSTVADHVLRVVEELCVRW